MPKMNFPDIPDNEGGDFKPLPPGNYHVQIINVEPKFTPNGYEKWNLQLEVQQGTHKKRFLYDALMFSASTDEKTQSCLKRVKLVCSRFGIDTSQEMDLEPDHLLGRQAIAIVELGSYEHATKGKVSTNKIGFAGYLSLEGEEEKNFRPKAVVHEGEIIPPPQKNDGIEDPSVEKDKLPF